MQIKASTPQEYMLQLPEERQEPMKKLRNGILQHLPNGFEEVMSYGMIGYVVPHSIYAQGYHCDPKLPLPFLNIASQKNYIALYHMGIYADQPLYNWFVKSYAEQVQSKLDMGKACIRFKNSHKIPFDLINELVSKMSVQQWIDLYEEKIKR